jgi:membrane-associated phospholipid phosphatase
VSESAPHDVEAAPVHEPDRRTEKVAAALLFLFALLTFVVRDRWRPILDVDETFGSRTAEWTAEHPFLVDVGVGVSLLGSWPVRFAMIAALAAFLVAREHRRGAWFVLLVAVSGTLLNLLVKALVDRPRPSVPDPVATAQGLSFPSGHAMAAAICYALVACALLFSGTVEVRARRTLLVLAVAIPLAVGTARVLLGVHYVSDVVGGWALGLAWVALTTSLFRPWRLDP